ncbi:MAG: hypothetical protein RLZZ244_2216 [Verrucomicrobiota bacterium]
MNTSRPTDIRVLEVRHALQEYDYRTPMKFGGQSVSHITLLNVECVVENRRGKRAAGFGSMPLSNLWAFPSRILSRAETLASMVTLSQRFVGITQAISEHAHPVHLGVELEEAFVRDAAQLSSKLALAEPIPKLAAMVVGSAFDAALHDAFGKSLGLGCFQTYGKDFLPEDLSHFLGADYAGLRLDQFVSPTPKARMPLYHLIGALDPLDEDELCEPVRDGLPNTLPEWIRHEGLTHFKLKLNGDDPAWDLERILKTDRVVTQTQHALGAPRWHYSLDFNERCPHVDYLVELLAKTREASPQGFERIQYVEQPTHRDLRAHSHNRMHAASKLRPVVIDESLTDLESLELAREMGYTGAALKACKGQTQSLLMAAAVRKLQLFLCVQDLTCPGASLIHSASLAAHIPGVAAIESNSRQYCPAANAEWAVRFPGLFQGREGSLETGLLTGPGLGAIP